LLVEARIEMVRSVVPAKAGTHGKMLFQRDKWIPELMLRICVRGSHRAAKGAKRDRHGAKAPPDDAAEHFKRIS
jgi:hypothetical protein